MAPAIIRKPGRTEISCIPEGKLSPAVEKRIHGINLVPDGIEVIGTMIEQHEDDDQTAKLVNEIKTCFRSG